MAQPAATDPRISCPVCRAPVHPIAGRCKHCKADLVRVRGGTTGAGETPVAIPTIGAGGAPAAAPLPLPSGRAGAAMPALTGAAAPQPGGPPPAGSASTMATTLPSTPSPGSTAPAPRPLPGPGASPTSVGGATRSRSRGWGQRWPLLVAVLAAVAILASLAVLVFGGGAAARKPIRAIGPAPERMDTDIGPPQPVPLPPGGAAPDPRGATPPPDPVDPFDPTPTPAPGAGSGPADPAPPADPDDPSALADPDDPTARLVPAPRTGAPRVDTIGEFLDAAVDVGCERLTTCLGSAGSARTLCDQVKSMRGQAGVVGLACTAFDPAAARGCLDALASIPCPGAGPLDIGKLAGLLGGVPACTRMCGP